MIFTSSEMIPESLKTVAKNVSAVLKEKGILHALVGGIAAGVYSNPRTTGDIDFIIPSSAESELQEFGDVSPLSSTVPGVTVDVNGVEVDFIFAPSYMPNSAYSSGAKFEGIPVLGPEAFILMKLLAGRIKDTGDIIEILKAGKVDHDKIKKYIKNHSPEELKDFESLIDLSDVEKSMGGKHHNSSINDRDEFKLKIADLVKRLESSKYRSIRVCSFNIRRIYKFI